MDSLTSGIYAFFICIFLIIVFPPIIILIIYLYKKQSERAVRTYCDLCEPMLYSGSKSRKLVDIEIKKLFTSDSRFIPTADICDPYLVSRKCKYCDYEI